MLRDRVRTDSYRAAIERNPEVFRDKVVLDVGCGTGILSIFAVKAGAAHVYAVDAAGVAVYAQEIVQQNGFAEKITVIRSKMEEVDLTKISADPNFKVDIIVSEWMGYCLLYESMMETVIYARDRWLKPGGLVLPDKFQMFVAGVDDSTNLRQYKKLWWKDVYGLDMSCLGKNFLIEPLVDCSPKEMITTQPCLFKEFDLCICTLEEATFANQYKLKMAKNGKIDALCIWFDVRFDFGLSHKVMFSTGPYGEAETHWKQTIFQIDGEYCLIEGDTLEGTIAVRPNRTHKRELDFKLTFYARDKVGSLISEPYHQYFIMT